MEIDDQPFIIFPAARNLGEEVTGSCYAFYVSRLSRSDFDTGRSSAQSSIAVATT